LLLIHETKGILKMEIFKVATLIEITELLKKVFPLHMKKTEQVGIAHALGCILSRDIIATEDVPHFSRSVVDGFAVRARDTFGASENIPGFLTLKGSVEMGQAAEHPLRSNEAVYIPTGGALPEGADAVVMIEYAEVLGLDQIVIHRPASPLENIMSRGDDIAAGECVLKRGTRLRPQEIGVLAALGIEAVEVISPVKVAILSTGDEIVPVHQTPGPGQIRDINSYTLSALVEAAGARVQYAVVVKDDFDALREALENALEDADLVLLSGGSSVGEKDYTSRVMTSFEGAALLAHGLAVKPGKPTVVACVQDKPVFGLPGQPASAMMIFKAVVEPLIKRMMAYASLIPEKENENGHETIGRIESLENSVMAFASANIHAAPGRTTFQMVSLEQSEGRLIAVPVHGKSGMISLMSRADGFIRIEAEKEGILQDEAVRVSLF
jgi:molybdopterin molybdotransferase